jgi:hypothetical protein
MGDFGMRGYKEREIESYHRLDPRVKRNDDWVRYLRNIDMPEHYITDLYEETTDE